MSSDVEDRLSSFRREMLRHFQSWDATTEDAGNGVLAAEIEADVARIAKENSSFATDAASQGVVQQVSLVLAMYLACVRRGIPEIEVRDAMAAALSRWVRENAETYAEARLGIRRDQPSNAFAAAKHNFKRRGEERFGRQFAYEAEHLDDNRACFAITRCLFNDLLRAAGHPEVIPVFCALDIVWVAEATQPRYDLDFQRPTTLAEGADKCRFQFLRRQGPRAGDGTR